MDWKGTRDRIQAGLADRIRDILLDRGRLSAKQIISTLARDTSQAPSRHRVNSVLYKRRDLFRHAPGPFWKAPQWEAIPPERVVLEAEAPEPRPIGVIEPIRDTARATGLEAEPSLEDLALRRERERRRAATEASPPSAAGPPEGIHISSAISGQSNDFIAWAFGERAKHIDGEPG